MQVVLSVSICVFLGKVAEHWFDHKTGLIADTILALQPTAILCDIVIQESHVLSTDAFQRFDQQCCDEFDQDVQPDSDLVVDMID